MFIRSAMPLNHPAFRICRQLVIPALCLLLLATGNAARRASARLQTANNPVPVVTVAAASYETSAIAPDGIVAAFGTRLATSTLSSDDSDPNTPGVQLPTTLGGTSVEVGGQKAGLFFVSPFQVNFVIPTSTAAGPATIVIRAGDGTISTGTMQVSNVAPSIFTANSDGSGVPAAYLVRVKNGGQQIVEALADYDAASRRFITRPLDLGPDGELVVLVLFASGVRKAADPNGDGNVNESVRVTIGGREFVPDYAGKHPFFVGLDQINVLVPRTQIGRGKIGLSITGAGIPSSNLCQIELAAATGSAPPVINGFSVSSALAGQTLNITGSGFSTKTTDNLIRLGGVEARLVSATATQLSVIVPFGAETGAATVRTPQGEGRSSSALPIRTSVSGFIENTNRQPISGVRVRVVGSNITTTSGTDGLFILPDLPAGAALIEVDGTAAAPVPPFPKVSIKQNVIASRDNPFSRPIALQQTTGTTFAVGNNSSPVRASSETAEITDGRVVAGNVTFDLTDNATALFPDGNTSGLLTLTVVENSRTPVNLPPGAFSSSIVQLTPFGVKLNPGGRLTFPNPQGFAAGTAAVLFRYDASSGGFVQSGAATVSADGQRIETAANAIIETSYYFVSVIRPTTSVVGRVVDSDGATPVRGAVVRTQGQEAFTDGNGGFVLRQVQSGVNNQISVEASLARPNGRIDRVARAGIQAVVNGTTLINPDLVLPGETVNRPPVMLVPASVTVNIGQTRAIDFTVTDPDGNQTVSIALSGNAAFVTLSSPGNGLYRLALAPNVNQAGSFTATLTATDNLNATTTQNIAITVTAYPDLAITMTDAPDPVIFGAGRNLTYTVNVTNNGPVAATGVTVTDTLPTGAAFISATPVTGSCSQSGGVVTCNVGNLAVNASTTISIVITPPNPAGSSGCVAAPAGLVAWYRGEGNANDAAGSNHGTVRNDVAFTSGKVGQAFSFDGIDDVIELGSWFNLQTFTIGMWVRPGTTQTAYANIIDNNHTDYRSWVLQQNNMTTNQYVWGEADGSVNVIFDLAPETWQYVAMTLDANRVSRVYVNGQEVGTATGTTAISYDGTQFLRLGSWGGGARNWRGQLDEVEIYNRSLTASEIQAVYNAGSAGRCVKSGCDVPGFAAPVTYAIGSFPRGLVAADFNGDGKPDLAATSEGGNKVSVRFNDGAGGLGAATDYTVGIRPYSLAAGDFNGDGKPDLIAANNSEPTLSVLLNNGLGGFTASNLTLSSNPSSVAVADFDGDNRADIAALVSGKVVILRNNGLGGFLSPLEITISGFPFSIVVADFNGDGRPDLAVGNDSTAAFSLIINNGAGNFAAPRSISGFNRPNFLAVGEFNGDGKPDLAVGNGNGNYVTVVFNDGTGGFTPGPVFSGSWGGGIATGDFNGDGKTDVAYGEFFNGSVFIASGDGNGAFGSPTPVTHQGRIFSLVVADFNGDGRPDLASSDVDASTMSVLLNGCTAQLPEFIINGASVSSSVPDPLPFNNLATVRTAVVNQ
ncbi:MAG: FG-GAP-like repeat-containing protein [Blastocatellia bacterium]